MALNFDQRETIGTSLRQIPAQVKKIDWLNKHAGAVVLDYGAGKYPQLVQHYVKAGGAFRVDSYEPYGEIEEHHTYPGIMAHQYDVVLCSNVLNVIAFEADLEEALGNMCVLVREEGVVYIQVYEGDRSGISERTTRGWQRNAPSKDYMEVLAKYFDYITFFDGRYECRSPIK